MNGLMIDSVCVMLVCFVLGAAIAWLLAAALYPTRKDVLAVRDARDVDGRPSEDSRRADDRRRR